MEVSEEPSKQLGSPFAKPSRKPWLVPSSASPFAIVPMVFFRRRFGEKFLTPSLLSLGALFLAFYAIALRFFAGGGHFALSQPVSSGTWVTWLVVSLSFLVGGSLHLIGAAGRTVMDKDEFSQSDGRPWEALMKVAPFVRDEWEFEMFFEPAVCIAVGALLLWFRNWFGIYLILCGWDVYQQTSKKYDTRRALDLTAMDATIEAAHQPDFDIAQSKPMPPIKPLDVDDCDNGEDQ